jgi:cytochrome c oxidase subunit 2
LLSLFLQARPNLLHSAGPQSQKIAWLFWFIFVVCFVVYVAVIVILLGGAARTKSSDGASMSTAVIENERGDQTARWWVGSAVAVTTITLFAVLFLSVRAGRFVQSVDAQSAVTIELTGHQWWWEVAYPNSHPDLRIQTANEIHVPTHEPIVLIARSADVIHSFWAPNVTGKRDLIPGYASSFSFQIDAPGTYRGQCAEFCGLQHAHMAFLIVAEPREDFDAWSQAQLQSAAEPMDEQSRNGKKVFLTHACVMCHTIRGTDAASNMGPDLTHVGARSELAAGTLKNVPGSLAGWILDPQTIKPGNHMAPNVLSGQELQELLSYLEGLK